MNSKITRKRRTDRNQVIYFIQDKVTLEYYIGLTAVCFAGNVRKTLTRRMQKHMQRALTENKDWGLSRALRERGADSFVFGVIEYLQERDRQTGDFYDNRYIVSRLEGRYRMEDLAKEMDAMIQGVEE